jgi:hypothetical protein
MRYKNIMNDKLRKIKHVLRLYHFICLEKFRSQVSVYYLWDECWNQYGMHCNVAQHTRKAAYVSHPLSHKPSAQGRGAHVTGVSAAYTFKLNKKHSFWIIVYS